MKAGDSPQLSEELVNPDERGVTAPQNGSEATPAAGAVRLQLAFLVWLLVLNALYYWQFRGFIQARLAWLLQLWR